MRLLFKIWIALSTWALAATSAETTVSIACGDVRAASMVIAVRGDGAGTAHLALRDPAGSIVDQQTRTLDGQADWTAHFTPSALRPATPYRYEVTFRDRGGDGARRADGICATAPAADQRMAVRFVVGGDVGGHGVCRDPERGYPIYAAMADFAPDFFIANGDMIYADSICPAAGPDGPNVEGGFRSIADPSVDWRDDRQTRDILFDHWRYNRAGPHVQALLRRTPMYVQWDDHEVINDFGAGWRAWPAAPERPGFPALVRAARDALFAYNPIARHRDEPDRIYRSFRWGQEAELFLLDARSYRSANQQPDGPDKTLLGAQQMAWLVDGLRRSDAVWKIVSSDVPLSTPTGSHPETFGRDGFANGSRDDRSSTTGFEHELLEILTALDDADVQNLIFVVTDVHLAMNLRYDLDLNGDGDRLTFHELLSGPLAAGRFPTPPQLDPTLRPTILYGEGDLLNFSAIQLVPQADGSSRLVAEVRGVDGTVRVGSRFERVAAAPISDADTPSAKDHLP